MTEHIQVYAKMVNIDAEMGVSNVDLAGIDASQVLNEFSVEERLESLELSDIADYLTKKSKEAMEDDDDTQLDEMINRGEWQPALDSLTVVRKG